MNALSPLAPEVRQHLLVTGDYWAFTSKDGTLRMLVVLHFHSLEHWPLGSLNTGGLLPVGRGHSHRITQTCRDGSNLAAVRAISREPLIWTRWV